MLNDSHTSPNSAVLVVHVADQSFGLPLAAVERVLPMASVRALPADGSGIIGALNLHGEILSVVDPRVRIGLATPSIHADQRLVLIGGDVRYLLWVDLVDDVVAATSGAADSAGGGGRLDSVIERVVRVGDAILPILSTSALAPRSVGA